MARRSLGRRQTGGNTQASPAAHSARRKKILRPGAETRALLPRLAVRLNAAPEVEVEPMFAEEVASDEIEGAAPIKALSTADAQPRDVQSAPTPSQTTRLGKPCIIVGHKSRRMAF
ncbi:hypothetical protein [Deinococcus sp. QL22]|uniref:hypothetical protein n=1 Tax=Deinococcus sp. QL22 TaxID=2939437 RepID=UPI002017BAC5|nr:hypothetical protein [Deinococcus sp. QL22]UQN09069.1 hypothetical protein M1R55_23755 [Deinococcus sp. QL22]